MFYCDHHLSRHNALRKLNCYRIVFIFISAGLTSDVLMKVSLSLVEQNECNRSYSSTAASKLAFGINPTSQICAGEKEGGKDTCQVRKI